MAKYIVKRCYGGDTQVFENKELFDAWIKKMASTNFNIYRIVGDENSGHYWLDFESMYEVNVKDID